MRTKTRLTALSVGILLVAGAAYWLSSERGQSVAPQTLHVIGEKRARRGHNPGVIGSNTASAGAHAATSTNGGSSTVRAADNTSAGAHAGTSIAGRGPAARTAVPGRTARATDSSTSIADGSDTIIPLTDTDAG